MNDERLVSVDDIARMWEIPYRDVWLLEAKGFVPAIDGRDASRITFREFMDWSDGPGDDWKAEDIEAWFSDARVEDFPDWQPRRNPGNTAAG